MGNTKGLYSVVVFKEDNEIYRWDNKMYSEAKKIMNRDFTDVFEDYGGNKDNCKQESEFAFMKEWSWLIIPTIA